MAATHPAAASHHLPWFIVVTTIVLVLAVFLIGVIFFRLHSLPERLGHKKLQFEIVAVLALLSLFTHIHLFWVIALILALIDIPDFIGPIQRIARGVERLSENGPSRSDDAGALRSADNPAEQKV
jgi:multisubunit Na+/H+ antiporter MnhF subunit